AGWGADDRQRAVADVPRRRADRARRHSGGGLHRVVVSVLRARAVPQPGEHVDVSAAGVELPPHADGHAFLGIAGLVVAAAVAAGPLLRGVLRARNRRVHRPAADRADVQPRQSLDLVDEPSVRPFAAVLRHQAPQLPRGGDPARLHHPVPAVVPDHTGPVHVPHVRRADFHGPRARLRVGLPCADAAAAEAAARRGRAPGDRRALLRLLLSGLDGRADLLRGVRRRSGHAVVGTEAVAHELSHPAARPSPDLLLELGAALFLVACAAAGFGVTYLSGVPLNLEERVVFGAVLGAMLVAATTFVPALLWRAVTPTTVSLGLLGGLAVGAAGVYVGRKRIVGD